jgi:hypothetical protein
MSSSDKSRDSDEGPPSDVNKSSDNSSNYAKIVRVKAYDEAANGESMTVQEFIEYIERECGHDDDGTSPTLATVSFIIIIIIYLV